MLHRIIAPAFAFSCLTGLGAAASARADDSVTGKWKLTYTVENEPKDYGLSLKQDGGKVSGELVSPRTGRRDAFEGGAIEGARLKLEIRRQNEEVFKIEAERKGPSRFEGKMHLNDRGPVDVVLVREAPSLVLGKWKALSKSPDGQEYPSTVELTEEGGALKGKSINNLGTIAFDSVSFDGKKFEFQITLPIEGNPIAFRVSAELKDPNSLVGSWKTRDADFSGEWSATREAPEAPKPAEPPKPADPPRPEPPKAPGDKALAGKWHAVVDSPDGKKTAVFELAVDGSKLTGKVHPPGGTAVEIKDGMASGNKVQFSITIKSDDGDRNIKVEAEIGAGGTLKGKWTLPGGESGELRAMKPVVL